MIRLDEATYQKHQSRVKAARPTLEVYKPGPGFVPVKPSKMRKESDNVAGNCLAFSLRATGILGWEAEYKFHQTRRWRIDFAWPAKFLAVEIEGGVWVEGRHTRGSGFVADINKYNALTLAGWRLLRFTPDMVESGIALEQIEAALHG